MFRLPSTYFFRVLRFDQPLYPTAKRGMRLPGELPPPNVMVIWKLLCTAASFEAVATASSHWDAKSDLTSITAAKDSARYSLGDSALVGKEGAKGYSTATSNCPLLF